MRPEEEFYSSKSDGVGLPSRRYLSQFGLVVKTAGVAIAFQRAVFIKFMPPQLTPLHTCAALFVAGTIFVCEQDALPATNQNHEAVNQLESGIIRTTAAAPAPRINGAGIFGVRPNHPFFYNIPVTGDRPMELFADHLPDALTLDSHSGIIAGSVAKIGKHLVTLQFLAAGTLFYDSNHDTGCHL